MRSLRILLVVLPIVSGAGCSGLSTSFDYDVEVDFAALSTYAWAYDDAAGNGSKLDFRRARTAIDERLQAAGYRLQDAAPDFAVAIGFATKDRVRVRDYGTGYRYRYGGYYGTRIVDIDEYELGTLVIDVLSPDGERLLWRGAATRTVDPDSTPEERTARIREAVKALLTEFPPQP